jgi:uncharacterized membrane protein YkoI
MIRRVSLLTLATVLLIGAACEEEENQATVTVREEDPGLLNQAGIPADSAVYLARAQVPGGRIRKAEIEREDGQLIYSFDVTPAEAEEEEGEDVEEWGEESEMILEVHVDAMDGTVLSVTEEEAGEEDEAAEAEEEAKEGQEWEEAGEAAMGQVTEESPGLFRQAAFSADSAVALARVRFPEARLMGGELEVENGRLVYSLDLGMEAEEGITEVWVDARTGRIVLVEHEGEGEEVGM